MCLYPSHHRMDSCSGPGVPGPARRLRPGAVEAQPGGAVPRRSRPDPAAPSRDDRGPGERRRPWAVEARAGGAVPGLSRPGPAAQSRAQGGRCPARRRRPGAVEALPGGTVPGRSWPGGAGAVEARNGPAGCRRSSTAADLVGTCLKKTGRSARSRWQCDSLRQTVRGRPRFSNPLLTSLTT